VSDKEDGNEKDGMGRWHIKRPGKISRLEAA
jgi:hypothetical protein